MKTATVPVRQLHIAASLLVTLASALLLTLPLSALFLPTVAQAAMIHVTTTQPSSANDTLCDLEEAIIAANLNQALYGCPAGDDSPTDTIVLAAGTTYPILKVYNLDPVEGPHETPFQGTGLPLITSTLTISGNGATIATNGSVNARILRVACTGNLNLHNVTLQNGRAYPGGGVYNWGTLTVEHSRIVDHQSEGIYSADCFDGSNHVSRLTIFDSEIATNQGGGVVVNYGPSVVISQTEFLKNQGGGLVIGSAAGVTITHSTFTGNQGGDGGAISSFGSAQVTVLNSTFSSNGATHGGAIATNGTLIISATELIANQATEAGGAVFQSEGFAAPDDLLISHSRLLNNQAPLGSAFYSTGKTTAIHESCIVGHEPIAVDRSHDRRVPGPRVDATRNWWGSSEGPSGGILGTGDSIGLLVDAGDYYTSTIFNCPSGPAMTATYMPDAANSDGQLIVVDTHEQMDVDDTDGNCTLPEAILAANENVAHDQCPAGSVGPDMILLEQTTYPLPQSYADVHGPTGLPSITSDITILGNGATIERSSAEAFRLFYVAAPAGRLTLRDVTLRNGNSDRGGAVYNRGTLILDHSRILSNAVSLNGGGIFNGSTINLDGTVNSYGRLFTRNATLIAMNRADRGELYCRQRFRCPARRFSNQCDQQLVGCAGWPRLHGARFRRYH